MAPLPRFDAHTAFAALPAPSTPGTQIGPLGYALLTGEAVAVLAILALVVVAVRHVLRLGRRRSRDRTG